MSDGEPKQAIEAEIARLERDAKRMDLVAHEAEEVALEDKADIERLKEDLPEREKTIDINVVVNGASIVIAARKAETLSNIRHKALEETHNIGRKPDEWEIKDEAGSLLDPERTVESYNLHDGVTIFISLRAGAAGRD